MKVKDLIYQLKKCDPELTVRISFDVAHGNTITENIKFIYYGYGGIILHSAEEFMGVIKIWSLPPQTVNVQSSTSQDNAGELKQISPAHGTILK